MPRMMTSADTHISIKNVTKKFGHTRAIDNLSLHLSQNRVYLLVGPNGSGKTTLIKCIMGLLRYEGTIIKSTTRIGYAPDRYIMPPYLNVVDFLESMGRVKEQSRMHCRDYIDHHLTLFELDNVRYRPIGALSSGMRQKVNLLQAMIHVPKILILDEPLKGLDGPAEDHFMKILSAKTKEMMLIISTHYPERFRMRGKRLIHLENGHLCEDSDV
ncbi:MAG: ABC transporter ATP-binding protein [Candidatus Izemoplasmatales bacterium]|nr:ABC transporter ATP-binding protein [Candidatus Izemoplasmatales bacterium]